MNNGAFNIEEKKRFGFMLFRFVSPPCLCLTTNSERIHNLALYFARKWIMLGWMGEAGHIFCVALQDHNFALSRMRVIYFNSTPCAST